WKDNHWAMLEGAPTLLGDVLAKAPPGMPVCVEVETDEQLEVALKAGASWLLIDNQSPEKLALWSRRIGNSAVIEASGGILPEDVRAYADAGADRISLGALTYSPDPVSISFEIAV
ncbi:MAG: nicotinate-nucleotide diphosphorylase (carboxylating), partial [Gemmatimonadota bacterium]|nr:nicotinate-nucleotide diphosphorylase (carboxylating) [Gemmatimonadota bacterium]